MLTIYPEKKLLIGDPIELNYKTSSDESVFIHLRRYYFDGDIEYSYGEFKPHDGEIDLEHSQPVSGTYKEADISGLFWSQKNTSFELDLEIDHLQDLTEEDKGYFVMDIIQGDFHACHKWQVIRMAEDVQEEVIDQGKIQGKRYYKNIDSKQGLVIHLAGEAGIDHAEVNAKAMASKGINTFALPIYGYKNLPLVFKELPLETIMETIDYIKTLKGVDPDKIVIVGSSRGAELALLIASLRSDINSLILFNPCDVVNQSVVKQVMSPSSSWTYKGQALKFSKVKKIEIIKMYFARIAISSKHNLMNKVYNHQESNAMIDVNQITSKMTMFAGDDDLRWTSHMMAKRIKSKVDSDLIIYKGAGQVLGSPGCLPTTGFESLFFPLGGSVSKNGKAQYDSWVKCLQIIKDRF